MEESLLDRTYRLLEASELTYREIADGAGVGFEWLKSLAVGRIAEPGASKIQRLHDFLAAAVPQNNASDGVRVPMQSA